MRIPRCSQRMNGLETEKRKEIGWWYEVGRDRNMEKEEMKGMIKGVEKENENASVRYVDSTVRILYGSYSNLTVKLEKDLVPTT